jgi:hypothetical protein
MDKFRYQQFAFTFNNKGVPIKLCWDGKLGGRGGIKFHRAVVEWLLLPDAKRLECRFEAPDAAAPVWDCIPAIDEPPAPEPEPEPPTARQRGYCVLRASTCRLYSGRVEDLERAHDVAVRAAAEYPGEVFEILESLGSCYVPVVPTTDWAPKRESFQLSPQ